jgi:hypothetical protein
MKLTTKICLILIAATTIASLPVSAQSTNTTTTTTNATPAVRRAPRPAYRGKVSAADAASLTLTVTGRQGDFKVKVTSKTKITKDGQPATFTDAAQGLIASGQGKKDADGNWEATTLRLTTPKTAAPAQTPKAPASGSGQ